MIGKNILYFFIPFAVTAFTTSPRTLFGKCIISTPPATLPTIASHQNGRSSVLLFEKEKKKAPFEEAVRSKLVSESIAPWRTLRLFFYVALGSGAFLGGLVTLTGVAATLSGAPSDVDLNTDYVNLAIDFGFVAAFAVLFKFDKDQGIELQENVEIRIQKKKEDKVIKKGMKERESTLGKLMLNIRISDDGKTQDALVEAVQQGGKQHMIIVAGPRSAIRDALLGANLLKMEFSMRDVLVVPYELDKDESDKMSRPDATKGFSGDSRPTWETQPYVASVVGKGWDEYIEAELSDAIKQSGEKVKEEGIAIVVANTGKITRRGVGKVPWRDMVAELEQEVQEEGPMDFGFLTDRT